MSAPGEQGPTLDDGSWPFSAEFPIRTLDPHRPVMNSRPRPFRASIADVVRSHELLLSAHKLTIERIVSTMRSESLEMIVL
jgi:hypothetical protein